MPSLAYNNKINLKAYATYDWLVVRKNKTIMSFKNANVITTISLIEITSEIKINEKTIHQKIINIYDGWNHSY